MVGNDPMLPHVRGRFGRRHAPSKSRPVMVKNAAMGVKHPISKRRQTIKA